MWNLSKSLRNFHFILILSRIGVGVTDNNGFWIRWLGLLALRLQLQPIITAHNQWLPKIRSIPYWSTCVFSSPVTNAEQKNKCSLLELPSDLITTPVWRMLSWCTNELSFITSDCSSLFCLLIFVAAETCVNP
jgi:hypothetical protein